MTRVAHRSAFSANFANMAFDRPDGWASTSLGTICELVSGTGFPLDEQGRKGLQFPFFKVGNLGEVASGEFLVESGDTVDNETAGRLRARIIPARSTLFAKIGMAIRLNRRRQVACACCIDNNTMAAIPNDGVADRYLLRLLETLDFMPLTQATTVPSLRKRELEAIPVLLPPLAEQKRIAATVEALLGRVRAASDRLAKTPALLKRFRQSVLAAACTGRLTSEWRQQNPKLTSDELIAAIRNASGTRSGNPSADLPAGETAGLPALPDAWRYVECWHLCESERALTYGVIKLGGPVADGIPTLRSSDVRQLRIDRNNIKRISPKIAGEFRRTFLRGGEILVTVRGTLGGVCVAPPDMAGHNISREVAMVPIKQALHGAFFAISIAGTASQNWLAGVEKGVAYTGINIEDLKRLPLPVPPLPEQHEIVRRVEALFALADRIERRVAAARARVERVTQAVLAKAFRGELVETEAALARREGRDYEPASVLLERIRATREAAERKPPKARKSAEKGQVKAAPTPAPPTKHSPGIAFRRAAVAAYIIEQHQVDMHFGRTKLEKLNHLIEYHCGIDLERDPVRDAAGPNDYPTLRKVEYLAEKRGWFQTEEREGGGRVIYHLGEKTADRIRAARAIFGRRIAEVDKLIDLLRPADTKQTEIVATLYASWNDFLLAGTAPTDEQIIQDVRENWHESKKSIKPSRWELALKWMRSKGLVPKGAGRPVRHRT